MCGFCLFVGLHRGRVCTCSLHSRLVSYTWPTSHFCCFTQILRNKLKKKYCMAYLKTQLFQKQCRQKNQGHHSSTKRGGGASGGYDRDHRFNELFNGILKVFWNDNASCRLINKLIIINSHMTNIYIKYKSNSPVSLKKTLWFCCMDNFCVFFWYKKLVYKRKEI